MNLPLKLKKLRKEKNMTQEAVAEKIHVSRQTMSNWETGKNYPDIQNLLYLSKLYGVSLSELLEDDIEELREKQKIERKIDIYIIASIFLLGITIMFFSIIILKDHVAISFILLSLSIVLITTTSITMERIKKENNIYKFTEILNYFNNCK